MSGLWFSWHSEIWNIKIDLFRNLSLSLSMFLKKQNSVLKANNVNLLGSDIFTGFLLL